jgi:hypothetical protein
MPKIVPASETEKNFTISQNCTSQEEAKNKVFIWDLELCQLMKGKELEFSSLLGIASANRGLTVKVFCIIHNRNCGSQ